LSGKSRLGKAMKGFQNSSPRAYFNRRAAVLSLLCTNFAFLLGWGRPCTFAGTQAPNAPRRALTFAERVAYQYAIEEVYWRHRIWPKENLGPKPSLDAVVSPREIRKRVEDCVRKSQLVADQRGSPITASELQTEMERMATHTRNPDVLRELFEALGNDPLVIAECMAKPILAERMLAERKGGSSAPPLDGKPNRKAITTSVPHRPRSGRST
jgi:hypothetical protein